LNGALLRGLFLGAHTSCLTPSVDGQSVPRFKHLIVLADRSVKSY